MPIGQRKPGRAVVERRRQPTHCVMAPGAIRKTKSRSGRWMHGIRGLLPRRQMASRVPAILRRDRQVVVVIDVAGGARHVSMPIRQQKPRRAVVELSVQPGIKRMASLARGREEI